MQPFIRAAIAALIIGVFAAFPALADIVTSAPASISTVVIPWGGIVSALTPAVGLLIFGGVMWIAKTIAPALYAILRTAQVEQLLKNAIGFGVNAVPGAVAGKTLSVNVGNDVLAQSLTYAVYHGGAWLQEFAGTPYELAEKLYARLSLEENAAAPDFHDVVDKAGVATT